MAVGQIPPPDEPPPRRCPDRTLPAYRFVPGLNPHPFRHPDGHAFTDGSAPAGPATPAQTEETFLWGLDLFDHRYWWEAHEAWEAVWHRLPRGSPAAELTQGLIQAAAALLKTHMGHRRAAERLLSQALVRLARADAAGELSARGLELAVNRAGWERYLAGGPCPPPLKPGR